jgi:hypothetical protein
LSGGAEVNARAALRIIGAATVAIIGIASVVGFRPRIDTILSNDGTGLGGNVAWRGDPRPICSRGATISLWFGRVVIVLRLVAWRLGLGLLLARADRRSRLLREWSLRRLRRQHINQTGLAGLLLLLLSCGLLLRLLHGLLHGLLHFRRNR